LISPREQGKNVIWSIAVLDWFQEKVRGTHPIRRRFHRRMKPKNQDGKPGRSREPSQSLPPRVTFFPTYGIDLPDNIGTNRSIRKVSDQRT
jgi:hypothetical protein